MMIANLNVDKAENFGAMLLRLTFQQKEQYYCVPLDLKAISKNI